jgi:adenylosuccinate synthase
MSAKAVIGLGFGDEGKGILTDYLCSLSKDPLVVRFSGGHQAGHTVVYNGIRHIFSSFGSGTLRGVPTYFSKFCTISPIGIFNEFKVLKEKGITPKLFIDKDCPVVTPYDQYNNQREDEIKKHGTCGVGFGATIEREEKHYHLNAMDLLYPSVRRIKLDMIDNYYGCRWKHLDLIDFFKACDFVAENENITISENINTFYTGDVIYEGSQGLLLDQDIGFFPHVTRSNTGSKNLYAVGMHPQTTFYLVTRAYQTRHGNGHMTTESIPHNIKSNPNETNVNNKYQGEFRRALLDLDLLKYAIKKDGNFSNGLTQPTLVITCLDHIVDEYRFVKDEKIVCCNDELDFVKKIASHLGIYKVLLSHSDESKNMIRLEF